MPVPELLEDDLDLVNNMLDDLERHDNDNWQLLFTPKYID